MDETKGFDEEKVRKIAREEAQKELSKEMSTFNEKLDKQGEIIDRLGRLLLGEEGMEKDETLKWKANFAYLYARRNTENKIIEKAMPALEWYDSMAQCEPGEKESKLTSLGQMISLFKNIKWILGLIGVTTLVNAIPWINSLVEGIEKIVNK